MSKTSIVILLAVTGIIAGFLGAVQANPFGLAPVALVGIGAILDGVAVILLAAP